MYELKYQMLSDENSAWGSIALLPWDMDVFALPVADYKIGDSRFVAETRSAFQDTLINWAIRNQVELISCSVPADNFLWRPLLADLGFTYVDPSLRVTLPRLQASNVADSRITIRLMEPDDGADVERIAETAIGFGRYHADSRFPCQLAHLRYRRWIHNAFCTLNPENRMYVIGQPGIVGGFFHIVLKDGLADLRLGAVDVALHSGIAGFNLSVGVLKALKQAGAYRATAKISAANIAVMNIYTTLGFRCSHPEAVFYWHAPDAHNLLSLDEIHRRNLT